MAALVAAEPKPEAKPDALIAAAYTAPLAYTVPASAVVSRSYHGNFAYPYAAPYVASPYVASPYIASPYVASPYVAAPVLVR